MALIRKIGVLPPRAGIVVGAWDPLFPEVEAGLRRLVRGCNKGGQFQLLPVLIDPSPQSILNPNFHPRFECCEARLARIFACGVEGAICLRLSKRDLEKGVEFFLDLLRDHTDVKCLFLGRNQSLGSVSRGDPRTVKRICSARGIEYQPSGISFLGRKRSVYKLYKSNGFLKIARLLRRPLSWVGDVRSLRLPLKSGHYRAKVADSLNGLGLLEAPTIDLDVDDLGKVRLREPLDIAACRRMWIAPTRLVRRAR